MDNTGQPWGAGAVVVRLPGCQVDFRGLSSRQKRSIRQDYGLFCPDSDDGADQADVICHAALLGSSDGIPRKELPANSPYPLEISSLDGMVEVTGSRFVAQFGRRKARQIQAQLAVAREDHLVGFGTLENFLRVLVAYQTLHRGGVLLHSAGVVHRGRAFLFSGCSTAGKTTLTRKAAAAGVQVLSDDINLVIPVGGSYCAHKVPFTGEFGRRSENRSGPGSFPLAGLALLGKAPALTVDPVSPAEAVAGLLTGCPFVNGDPEEFPLLTEVLTELVAQTPVVRLGVAFEDPFEAVMETMARWCGDD